MVIKGSDAWKPDWKPTDNQPRPAGSPPTFRAVLAPAMFESGNVFAQANFPPTANWAPCPGFELRRGQLLLDDAPFRQVNACARLRETQNAYWVEEDGLAVPVRLAGDSAPHGRTFEITTRPQVFAPTARFLGYIRVSGFRMFHSTSGVPIPYPPEGALSTTAGHDWIILLYELMCGYSGFVYSPCPPGGVPHKPLNSLLDRPRTASQAREGVFGGWPTARRSPF